MTDNIDKKNSPYEGICIYSLRQKIAKPLVSIDLMFRKMSNGKLEWMMYDELLRGGCFVGKDDLTLFDDINDFIEYRKDFLSQLGLSYPCEKIEIYPKLKVGEFYPNIYRPEFSYKLQKRHFVDRKNGIPFSEVYDDPYIFNREEYSDYLRQLEIIINDLNEVFKVIAPSPNNYKCYGNSLRNIIVLACTEIDSMMHNILVRNEYCKDDAHTSMNDYRILNEALRLDEYSISFVDYLQLKDYVPFKEWTNKNGSLTWYNAYNHVKHKRSDNFQEANLENAILAVMGFALVLVAQYGFENNMWNRKLGNYLKITRQPKWDLSDFYIPYTDDMLPVKINYPFPKNKSKQTQTRAKLKEVGTLLKNKASKADVLDSIDELRNLIDLEYIE